MPPSQALPLHDVVDGLASAWDRLACAFDLRIEGWPDDPDRIQAALDDVHAASREANVLVARALESAA